MGQASFEISRDYLIQHLENYIEIIRQTSSENIIDPDIFSGITNSYVKYVKANTAFKDEAIQRVKENNDKIHITLIELLFIPS